MDENTRRLRSVSRTLRPRFIIGKNGLTEHVIKDIVTELKYHELVKIKILPTYISDKDKAAVVAEIVNNTNSRLIDFIGFTITLSRR